MVNVSDLKSFLSETEKFSNDCFEIEKGFSNVIEEKLGLENRVKLDFGCLEVFVPFENLEFTPDVFFELVEIVDLKFNYLYVDFDSLVLNFGVS